MKQYEALAADLESAIREGVLRPGDRLPSVRQTAGSRRVSASTVFQAYYQLEAKGLVEARERSGYFVRPSPLAVLPRLSSLSTPPEAATFVNISQAVFDILQAGSREGVVPLGSPFPDPGLFPLAQLGKSMAVSTRNYTGRHTVEDLSPGKEALRRLIAQRYVARGVNVHHDEIVITNGALEALNLSLATVARPGDTIAVESPGFYAALQALERLGMRAAEIPTHPEYGVDLDRLEHAIHHRGVKACWLMPTFQNPLGATMPDERKRELVELLSRHGVPLIEDDVYAELHFCPKGIRPAKAWDREGLVLHCGSFSKCLSPGYRIGWVTPGRYFRDVARQKLSTTLMASMPAQLGLVHYLRSGSFDPHLRKLRRALADRHEQMVSAVERYFPEGSCATRPQGSYFMWIEMPPHVDAFAILQQAADRKICFTPGRIFSPSGHFRNCARLNFSYGVTPRIEKALEHLGRLARAASGRATATQKAA